MLALLIGVFGLFALIVYVSLVFFDHPTRMTLVGWLSVASLISMSASPLLVIVCLSIRLSKFFWKFLVQYLLFWQYLVLFSFSEFGDKDKERGVHAILPLSGHIFNEHLLLRIRLVTARLLYLRKSPILCSFLDSVSNLSLLYNPDAEVPENQFKIELQI